MADKMDVSSPESSGENITTPKERQIIDPSALSPPDSQQRSNMPLSTSGSLLANSNGKRPIQTISNGSDEVEAMSSIGNGGVSLNGGTRKINFADTKSHRSGYTWSAAEDEPGHAWMSKKAQDDYKRASDQMAHRDQIIGAKYGDIFELVENERAVLASMQQR